MLDLFFPKYCVSCKKIGRYICDSCFAKISFSQKTICLVCTKAAIDGLTHPRCLKKDSIDGCFLGYEYAVVVKKLLYVLKYKPHVTDIQKTLHELFYESLIQKEGVMHIFQKERDIIIAPIPLHAKRFKTRGYNHASLLAKNLSKSLEIKYQDLLKREKETAIQAGLSKQERKENMKDAFALQKNVTVLGKTVLLVDDIVTTGTTFTEAAKVLKHKGAKKVFGLAFSGEN